MCKNIHGPYRVVGEKNKRKENSTTKHTNDFKSCSVINREHFVTSGKPSLSSTTGMLAAPFRRCVTYAITLPWEKNV